MVGTTADKKKEKVIKVKGWKQYYDQVQFEMLVSGLDKSMLLLTDPAWNMYAIDMMADNAWQADTIFACNLISELSKLLLPAKVTHHIPITSHHMISYHISCHLILSYLASSTNLSTTMVLAQRYRPWSYANSPLMEKLSH